MTDWPFEDAQQGHPISEKHRIPVVGSPYPRWRYHVALMVTGEESPLWSAIEPTDAEAAQLASYLEFWLTGFYNERWLAKMRERPFDIDSGTVTRTFHKTPDGSWKYRQDTWEHGPWPFYNSPKRDHTLVELLDHITNLTDERWETWKAERPDVFPMKVPA